MSARRPAHYWLVVAAALLATTLTAGTVAAVRYSPGTPVTISQPPETSFTGTIFVSGAVAVPGAYPIAGKDTLDALVTAAGGIRESANLSGVRLLIPANGNSEPQKIDINRAEAWLLMALPGIGETLAKRIVAYRQANGPFRHIAELTEVGGIGQATFNNLKDLITVAD